MESIKLSKKKRVIEAQRFIAEYLSSHPCVDCGIRDIRVLEFDHVTGKDHNVTKMANHGYSIQSIRSEISKCEVRCCNCHFIKTQERMGGGWREKFLASLSPLASNQLKA
jgi:hypothetical protein